MTTLHNVSYATFTRRAVGALFVLFLGLILTLFQPPPSRAAASEPVWGYLDNGMAYVLLESHAAPLIGSSVIVHSGSSRETMATSGASHFLEHLLFNGTATRTQEQLYDQVDAIGGYNNATTRKTHVAYMMVTSAEKIRTGLEIQADMLFHSTLDSAKVEKERGIILAEMAKDQDSGGFDEERLLDLALFGPSGPGLPTLGSVQSLQNLSRASIARFYKRYYSPQNMTLVVVGDFVSSEMEGEIRSVFGTAPPGETPPVYLYPEPDWDPIPEVIPTNGEALILEWTWRGPDPKGPDFLSAECAYDLLGGDETAPLNKAVRARFEDKIRSAGGRIELVPGGSFYRYRIEADPSLDWQVVAEALPAMIETARSAVPQPADVDAWKVSAETQEYYLRERPHYYAIMAGEQIAAEGVGAVLGLPRRLAATTPATVAASTAGWCRGGCRTVVLLPQIPSAAADAAAKSASTSSQTKLANGVDLLVLSSPESPVLALHLFVRGRSQAEPAGLDGAVECLQRLLPVRTQTSDPATMTRRLRSIGAELKTADDANIPYDDFYSSSGFSFVRMQTLDRYAPEAFALLQEMLARPGWTDADFAETQKAMIASAERAAVGSTATARLLVRETLYPGLPRSRAVFGTPASLKSLTPGALRELAGRYYVGNRMLLVVVTSLPAERISEIAAGTIGQMPSGEAPPPPPPTPDVRALLRADVASSDPVPADLPGLALPAPSVLRAKKIGARQAAVTWVRPLGNFPAESMPELEVWNAALSGKIQFQLREREGLAYSIGSSVDRLDDGTLLWVASAGTAAASVPRILQGFQEELERAMTAAPDSLEVRKQGAQIYGRSLMRRATRMNRAYAAGLAVIDGRDPAGIDDEIRAPMGVTAEAIAKRIMQLDAGGPGLVTVVY